MARAKNEFNATSFLVRLCFAFILVFATYNPEGFSYYHWAIEPLFTDLSSYTFSIDVYGVLKIFVGIVLIICWVIFVRATLRSLGPVGVVLAIAFFAALFWLIASAGIIPTDSVRAVTYVVLIILCGLLATGMSWSHIRRRLTGQFDTDEIQE